VLTNGFEVEVDGKKATLSLLRSKNKFADGGKNEPTRFRNMTSNMILSYDGRTVIAEMQIHHIAILAFNELADAHAHYNFFRALLASLYEAELDAMLERVILFLEEVRGVPVLLSMLVLLFKHREEGSTEPLPASRYDLYEMATRLAAKEENVLRMLRHIAAANQLA